jgi:hypothetical protein
MRASNLPPYPYNPGVILRLYPTRPPTPPKEFLPQPPDYDDVSPEHLIELYRQNFSPPLPNTPSDMIIRLDKSLRVGFSGHPAQVVRAVQESVMSLVDVIVDDLAGDSSYPAILVAKIYDPLYYYNPKDHADSYGVTHECIANETESYHRLAAIQGTVIPRFHGCYVCPVPEQNRNAWVLLMQYIPGKTLEDMDIDPFTYVPPDVRRIIMKKVADAAFEIALRGVEHRDYAPRNAILWLNANGDTNEATPTGSDVAPAPTASAHSSLSHETLLTVDDLSNARVFIIDLEYVRFNDLSSEREKEQMRLLLRNTWVHDFRGFAQAGWATVEYLRDVGTYYYKAA